MHYFRGFIIFLNCVFLIEGQQVIKLNMSDSTKIKAKLDSLIGQSPDLTIEYRLHSYQLNSNSATYVQHSEYKPLDTIFVVFDEPINNRTLNQIISPLRSADIGNDIGPLLNQIRNRYYFLTKMPEYQFGIHKKDRLGIILNIRPEFNSYFSGHFGLHQTIDGSWSIVGEMDLHFENIWETAGENNLYWQRIDSTSQKFKIHMYEPHLLGWVIGTDLKYSQEIFKGLFTDSQTNFAWQIPGFSLGSIYLGYVSGEIIPTDKGLSIGYLQSRFKALSIAFKHDSHNRRILPNQGVKLNLDADIGVQGDDAYIQAEFEGDRYLSISKQLNIYTGIWGKIISLNNNKVPISRRVRFGGINGLRGYNDKEFSADAVSIQTLELHYMPTMYWRTEIFLDMAFIKALDHIPFGLGFGFSQVNDSAVIKVQYALPKDNGILDGKLHLSWVSRL